GGRRRPDHPGRHAHRLLHPARIGMNAPIYSPSALRRALRTGSPDPWLRRALRWFWRGSTLAVLALLVPTVGASVPTVPPVAVGVSGEVAGVRLGGVRER